MAWSSATRSTTPRRWRARASTRSARSPRACARATFDDLGLASALQSLAADSERRTGIEVETFVDGALHVLEPDAELVLYRGREEALTNSLRHGGCSRVTIEVRREEDAVVLRVADDGAGLGDAMSGAGIRGMRERSAMIGGRLRFTSPPTGGTAVELRVPAGGGARCLLTPGRRAAPDPARRRPRRRPPRAAARARRRARPDRGRGGRGRARRGGGGVRTECDLAVLDVSMPRMGGLQAARELVQRRPALRILMLSMHRDEQFFLEAPAGRRGRLRREVGGRPRPHRRLPRRDARRDVPVLRRAAPAAPVRAARRHARRRQLSDRESEVLALIAEGHTTQEIAQILVISPRTVDRHRENLLAKLNLRNRVELARYAIRHRLIEP